MTQTLLLIILGELSVVLLTGLIVLLLVNRRQKRQRLAGIEALLEDVEARGALRGDSLFSALMNKHSLDEQSAHEVSETLLAAEKQFLYVFVEQQMQQHAISGFYESLCQLLDSYLDGLVGQQEKPQVTDTSPAEDAEPPATDGAEPPADAEATSTEENPPPPEWGDVFD